MREDLVQYVPAFRDMDTLLCPICCRALTFDKFSVEHIIPQQAVKLDPISVKKVLTKNERSGVTLLCSENIIVGGKNFSKGCNGWKGRNFDTQLKDLLNSGDLPRNVSDGHIIAVLTVGYLGLFKQYGYRAALTQSARVLRNQFFNPKKFTKHLPLVSQMLLKGDPQEVYNPNMDGYWSEPVQVHVVEKKATIIIRNYFVNLPLSHDPTVPLAKTLLYAPSRYVFRPDLRLAFS